MPQASPRFPVSFSHLKNMDLRPVDGRLPQGRLPLFVQFSRRPAVQTAGSLGSSPGRMSAATSQISDMGTLKMEGSKLNKMTLFGLKQGQVISNEYSPRNNDNENHLMVTQNSQRLTPRARCSMKAVNDP